MKTAEASGTDLTDAIENGIKILRVRREEVDYEIISETDDATQVKVTIKEPHQHLSELASFILTSCGFKPNITVTKDDKGLYLNIKTKRTLVSAISNLTAYETISSKPQDIS
jgi:predicted RNA-binding protein Jag